MTTMNSIDQQFVEYIVKSLVSQPDKVIIERRIDEKGVLLELTVDPEDLGRPRDGSRFHDGGKDFDLTAVQVSSARRIAFT